ncbi:hypothetical protein FGB62_25g241 [Gracilaria domingensis]|nr:hypothetical protein FGB62_25g241 [Gracilaria domingensis]
MLGYEGRITESWASIDRLSGTRWFGKGLVKLLERGENRANGQQDETNAAPENDLKHSNLHDDSGCGGERQDALGRTRWVGRGAKRSAVRSSTEMRNRNVYGDDSGKMTAAFGQRLSDAVKSQSGASSKAESQPRGLRCAAVIDRAAMPGEPTASRQTQPSAPAFASRRASSPADDSAARLLLAASASQGERGFCEKDDQTHSREECARAICQMGCASVARAHRVVGIR